jgi:hypothetical protein
MCAIFHSLFVFTLPGFAQDAIHEAMTLLFYFACLCAGGRGLPTQKSSGTRRKEAGQPVLMTDYGPAELLACVNDGFLLFLASSPPPPHVMTTQKVLSPRLKLAK